MRNRIIVGVCGIIVSIMAGSARATFCIPPGPPPLPPVLPSTPPECKPCPDGKCTASPCYVASGAYANGFTDLQIVTASFPIDVGRNYNSARPVDGPLGIGWASTLTPRLVYGAYLYAAPSTYVRQVDVLMPDGFAETFTDGGNGGFTPPAARQDRLVRNGDGTFDLTPQHSRTTHHFNSDGTLAWTSDAFGNSLAYTYTNGKVTHIADAAGSGRYVDITWGANGRIADVEDLTHRHVQYTYLNNTLTQVTLSKTADPPTPAFSHTTTMTYVSSIYAPLLDTIRDKWGRLITRLAWDSRGRLTSYTEGDPADESSGETYVYTYVSGSTTKTHSLGSKTYNYALGGSLITGGLNTFDSITGLLASSRDSNGNATSYTYDASGRPLTVDVHAPGGTTWTYTYDGTYPDKVATIKAGGWAGYAFDYFAGGSPAPGALKSLSRFRTDGTTKDWLLSFTYDNHGRIQSTASANTGGRLYSYDAAGNRTQVVAATTTNLGYDSLGRLTSVSDAFNHAKTFEYDAHDRVTKTTLPPPFVGSPLSFTTTITYDVHDTQNDPIVYTEVRDPNGRTTRHGFDVLGNLVRTVDALGNVTLYKYLHNLLATMTDANGNVTTYGYDSERRLERTTFPDGLFETYSYRTDGRLLSKTDRRGATFDYAYDGFGRVASETVRVGGVVQDGVSWNYGGQNLTSTSSSTGTNTYTYDSRFRLLTETQGSRAKITYTYADINSPAERQIASYTVGPATGTGYSPRVDYSYDSFGRVTTLHWTPVNGDFSVSYGPNGDYSSITFPNGQVRSFTYDDQGRLTQIANVHPSTGDLATFTYGYDHDWTNGLETMLGQETSVTVTGSAVSLLLGQTRYSYDAKYQLIRADYPGASGWESWSYDAIGNRIAKQTAGGTPLLSTYDLNAQGKNTQRLRTVGQSPSYTYDANGNQLGMGPLYFTWDVFNHMASSSAGPAAFAYDAAGRRSSRAAFGATTSYLYVGHNTVGERNPTPQAVWNDYLFLPGVDQALAMSSGQGGVVSYFGVDALGSVVLRSDQSGNVLDSARYSPWGETTVGSIGALFGYTGREQNGDGLLHYRMRQYWPFVGRFLTEDPLSRHIRSAALDAYRYVVNSPVMFDDPYGLSQDLGGCTARAIYGIKQIYFTAIGWGEWRPANDAGDVPHDIEYDSAQEMADRMAQDGGLERGPNEGSSGDNFGIVPWFGQKCIWKRYWIALELWTQKRSYEIFCTCPTKRWITPAKILFGRNHRKLGPVQTTYTDGMEKLLGVLDIPCGEPPE